MLTWDVESRHVNKFSKLKPSQIHKVLFFLKSVENFHLFCHGLNTCDSATVNNSFIHDFKLAQVNKIYFLIIYHYSTVRRSLGLLHK